ncbi:excisionase family DNA-binding protein [Nitriliruptor alkaliphilus]|uniref:excisionase family DNA-binding protein n=1 Tax=Nitriliruptor alkaliphilus TaxID=427918 RepID=UPI0006967EE6|nr:excisionase family DNA-binding protein [Nitriliruptor alkaliphilus]
MTTTQALPPTITVEQAGGLLGLPVRTTYRAAARGEIPAIRVGRRLLVPTMRLLDLLGLDADDAALLLLADEAQPA